MTSAQERYVTRLESIMDRLIKLQNWKGRQLERADGPSVDWRDVGDAAHVDDLLAMACEFLEMEPETPHPNHAGVKYAVYLSPEQGEAAMILGDGSVNAGIVEALALARKSVIKEPWRACLDREGNYYCTLPFGHKGDHADRSVGPPASVTWTNRVNP